MTSSRPKLMRKFRKTELLKRLLSKLVSKNKRSQRQRRMRQRSQRLKSKLTVANSRKSTKSKKKR